MNKVRAKAVETNNCQPSKKPRWDRVDDLDDDFPDADFTVEEFDLCLTQATGSTSKPTSSTTNAGEAKNGVLPSSSKDLSYNLDGQIQLLQRKVASLSKELHDTRLSKQDELKAQADAFSKERLDLKAQIEFKDGELRSSAIRQATLEEKLRSKGIETRLKQAIDEGTSTDDAPICANANVAVSTPKRINALSWGSDRAAWLSSQYGMYPLPCSESKLTELAHLDLLRDFVIKRKHCDMAQAVPDAVILSLRGLGESINETLMCASTADSTPCERVSRSAEKFSETFKFDLLADLSYIDDARLLVSVVNVLNSFALSSERASSAILKQTSMLSHLLLQVGEEPVTIPILRLFSLLADTDNSLALFSCCSPAVACCMWKNLCKPFETNATEALLCEGIELAERASSTVQNLCPCFAWFVTKLTLKLRAMQLSSSVSAECSNVLLSRIIAVAQMQPQHRLQVCRLLTSSKYHAKLAQAWPFLDEEASQCSGSDHD